MQTAIFSPKQSSESRSKKAAVIKLVVAFVFIGALCGTGWWWFFGSKPRVVLTVPFVGPESTAGTDCWLTSRGEVAVLAGEKMTLVELKSRKELWSVPLPVAVPMETDWQESVSMRFLKLQVWAEELAAKRGKLKGDAAVKAFNVEAAQYASELALARADAARPSAFAPDATVKKPQDVSGGGKSPKDKFKPIALEEDIIRRARMAKRADQIAKLRASVNSARPVADTRLKLLKVRDDETRLRSLEQEQSSDEAVLPKSGGKARESLGRALPEDYAHASGGRARFVELGEILWLAEGSRLIGFERSGGGVKTTMFLPGPVTRMVAGADVAFFVAYAGKTVRFVVKVGATGGTQTSYFPVAEETDPKGGPAVQTEFFGNDSLSMVEIRAIAKPAAEPSAAEAANATPNVATMPRRGATTYSVTVKRPFASALPAWRGEFVGRVQCFATPSLSLVTGGNKLVALDANNAKVWESTLSEPAVFGDRFQWDAAGLLPCREHSDRLYFFDRAELSVFSLSNGEVIWRLPRAGLRNVEFTADGTLYVHSMNRPVEVPSHLSEVRPGSDPSLMKVHPSDGTILWEAPKFEAVWASGKDVYSMRIARTAADGGGVALPVDPRAARMKIYKLNPGTGSPRWDWYQTRVPERVIANGKTLAVLFADSFELIHSTAL